jgi:hypothetical protein
MTSEARTSPAEVPAASDGAQPPAPLGALFEAAFRRFGSHFAGYTIYAVGFSLIPVAVTLLLRQAGFTHSSRIALAVFWAALAVSHLALVGTLTGLVCGTLRRRAVGLVVVTLIIATIIGAAFTVIGPLILITYPLVVFVPVAVVSEDATLRRAPLHSARLVAGDLGRSYGAFVGLGVCAVMLWFGFQLAFTSVGGTTQLVATFVLTMLLLSPIAALVERNLYGDLTGRVVLPASVSRDQVERGKRRRRA